MPTIDFAALPATMVRPFIVAIAHVPILLVTPVVCLHLIVAIFLPGARGEFALTMLCELRTWSVDAVLGTRRVRRS